MTTPARISKRKLANPVQAPADMGFKDATLEAEARKTRYISLSLKELVANNAPTQAWTTTRPTGQWPDREDMPLKPSKQTPRLDLGKVLAKIPTRNDRALRGKLDRIVSCASREDQSADTYNEPETPSSLPPRNTVPKNLSPTYIPPGRRGSRVSANLDDRPYHHVEVPLVQAPLPKRSYSSTSIESLNAAKRRVSLRRTTSTGSVSDAVQARGAFEVVQPSTSTVWIAPKRGRPRKPVPQPGGTSIRPEALVKTWTKRKLVDTPLVSPSTSSTGGGTASTIYGSSVADDEDDDLEEDEDDTYTPPPSHRKKKKSPPISVQRAANRDTVGKPRRVVVRRSSSQTSGSGCQDNTMALPAAVAKEGAAQHLTQERVPLDNPEGPTQRNVNEKKRIHAEMSCSDAANLELQPYRKLRLGRPFTLTLRQSNLSTSVPGLRSPVVSQLPTQRGTNLRVVLHRVKFTTPFLPCLSESFA